MTRNQKNYHENGWAIMAQNSQGMLAIGNLNLCTNKQSQMDPDSHRFNKTKF